MVLVTLSKKKFVLNRDVRKLFVINLFDENIGGCMVKGGVLFGDKTTHGGQVISASSNITVNGKKVALVGDMVSCPVSGHGVNPILEGIPQRTCNGRSVVADGCKCQCGCQVISSAINSTIG